MEKNEEYAYSIHNSINSYDDTLKNHLFSDDKVEKDFFIEDLLQRNITNTCCILFRYQNHLSPDFFAKLKLGDWPLQIILAQNGKIKYFPDVMAVYRAHSGGIWSGRDSIERVEATVKMFELINDHLKYKYETEIKKTICRLLIGLADELYQANNRKTASYYFQRAKSYCNVTLMQKIKYMISPAIYKSLYTLKWGKS